MPRAARTRARESAVGPRRLLIVGRVDRAFGKGAEKCGVESCELGSGVEPRANEVTATGLGRPTGANAVDQEREGRSDCQPRQPCRSQNSHHDLIPRKGGSGRNVAHRTMNADNILSCRGSRQAPVKKKLDRSGSGGTTPATRSSGGLVEMEVSRSAFRLSRNSRFFPRDPSSRRVP
jgi:hypothetical protein